MISILIAFVMLTTLITITELWSLMMRTYEIKSFSRKLKATKLNIILEGSKLALNSVYYMLKDTRRVSISEDVKSYLNKISFLATKHFKERFIPFLEELSMLNGWYFNIKLIRLKIEDKPWRSSDKVYEAYLKILGVPVTQTTTCRAILDLKILLVSAEGKRKVVITQRIFLPISVNISAMFMTKDLFIKILSNEISAINGSVINSLNDLRTLIREIFKLAARECYKNYQVETLYEYTLEAKMINYDAFHKMIIYKIRIKVLYINVSTPLSYILIPNAYDFMIKQFSLSFKGPKVFEVIIILSENRYY